MESGDSVRGKINASFGRVDLLEVADEDGSILVSDGADGFVKHSVAVDLLLAMAANLNIYRRNTT
jgi:hypothetical protein